MRYLMRQRLFSFGDDFYVKDASGQDVFFVDGKALSFGDQLSFQDLAGNELAYIHERVLSWGPTYEIYTHALAAIGRCRRSAARDMALPAGCFRSPGLPGLMYA